MSKTEWLGFILGDLKTSLLQLNDVEQAMEPLKKSFYQAAKAAHKSQDDWRSFIQFRLLRYRRKLFLKIELEVEMNFILTELRS